MTETQGPSCFSQLFLLWTKRYTELQALESVKQYDIDNLPHNQTCQIYNKKWKQFWDVSYTLGITQDRLKWSLTKAFSHQINMCILFNFFSYQLNALIPVFIYYLSEYIKGETNTRENYIYLVVLIFLKISKAICHMQGQFRLKMLGNKIFSCLGLAITQKALKNLDFSKKFYSPAEQAKIMQYDCARILNYPFVLISATFQIYMSLFTLASVTYLTGWVGFISCLSLFCFQTLRLAMGPIFRRYQELVNQRTQERILKTTQVINNIKYIKVNAYQEHFFYKIQNLRFRQISKFRILLNLKLLPMFFIVGASRFAIFVFIIVGIAQGVTINASIVFSVLLFYNYMALNRFLDHFNTIEEGEISIRKVQQFLQTDQRDISFIRKSVKSQRASIEVQSGNFYWEIPNENDQAAIQQGYSIKNINFSLKPGQFVALVGSYGSGKTSIIQSMFGQMQNRGKSSVQMNGNIAYADQRPWIMNDTVKNNILFGEPFDSQKYRKTIKYSCMEKDLVLFTNGQDTMIGQGGSTISGGQRARISLARALYKDADIYILDDILSAVDAHVSAFIFKQTLLKHLKGKTIVLATHLLNYLYLTDKIFMIQNGQIKQILNGKNPQLPTLARMASNRQSKGKKQKIPEEDHPEPQKISSFHANQDEDLTYADYINLYIRKNGGNIYIFIIVLYVILVAFTGAMAFKYLNTWMNSQNVNNPQDFYIFLAIVVSGSLTTIIYCLIEHNSSLFIRLHYQMLSKIITAPMSFFQTTPNTEITNKLSTDLKKVDNEVMSKFRNILYTLAIALAFIFNILNTYIARSQYVMIFLITGTLVIMVYNYVKYMEALRKFHILEHDCEIPVFSNFSEIVSGAVTIRAFNKIDFMTGIEINHIDTFSKVYKATVGIDSHFTFLITVLTSSIAFIVFVKILLLQSTHSVDFFILYNVFSFEKVILNFHIAFLQFIHNIKHVKYCQDVLSIVQEQGFSIYLKQEVYESSNTSFNIQHEAWIKQGHIRFDNFSVKYRPELNPVLDSVSFDIRENEKIGVVGRTGSGKSTTLLSLLRILQEHEGTITVDDKDIYKLDIQTLRSGFSTILQEHYLFSGNIRDNVDPLHKFSDQKVNKALKLCGLYDAIKNRQGLDTIIDQNGDNFSAGQKQLINISRTLLNPKKVVLVDEATASIDYKSDQILQKVIKTEFKNVTMITIAHRIQTILESDRIMVLDKGKLQQFDTPKRLLQNPASLFYQLHQQSQKSSDAM